MSDSGLELVFFIGLFSHIWVYFHIFGIMQEAIERLRIGKLRSDIARVTRDERILSQVFGWILVVVSIVKR